MPFTHESPEEHNPNLSADEPEPHAAGAAAGVQHSRQSTTDAPNPEKPAKGPDESSITALALWILKNGPVWARIPVILAIVAAVLASPLKQFYELYAKWADESPDSQTSKTLQAGSLADAASLGVTEEMIRSGTLTADQQKELLPRLQALQHQMKHLQNPSESQVKWVLFAKKSKRDYMGYKLYPSDNCLLISRVKDGVGKSEWVYDPSSAENQLMHPSPQPAPRGNPGLPSGLHQHENPAPALRLAGSSGAVARLQHAQYQCLNPHPGMYQERWGYYLNSCEQPVYRYWADGCWHVQVYNHCSNFWGPVVWQFCAAAHRW